MKNKIILSLALALSVILGACDNSLPGNPVVQAPISGLIINVSGEDFTALPAFENDSFKSEMSLAVKVPDRKATITQISLADNSLTANVKNGDVVEFVDNVLPIILSRDGNEVSRFNVVMSFNPPPFYYFVKTSDRDADGNGYYLDLTNPQVIASGTYDKNFEGEIDLTTTNWDNICLVKSDQTAFYDYAGGPWPAVSYYTWTGTEEAADGTGYFRTGGPWNDWLTTNGNPAIVSPGVWRVQFDNESMLVEMTMTQWTVTGSALASPVAMRYDAATRTWNASATLTAGKLRFETIPVMMGDPTFNLGLANGGISTLKADGTDITVTEAGTYAISLVLSNPPYYTYSITRQ